MKDARSNGVLKSRHALLGEMRVTHEWAGIKLGVLTEKLFEISGTFLFA